MQPAPFKILAVEDDENLGYLIKENLETMGYDVILCENGNKGLTVFRQNEFQLCILDIMMPLKDGITVAKEIRKINDMVPIIFLTSLRMEKDRIAAFQSGADDFITKPFSMKELALRINAITRRIYQKSSTAPPNYIFKLGSSSFDSEKRILTVHGENKSLSMREAELLKLFCENKNTLLYRNYILNKIWKNDDYFIAKSMDVYITRLRKLIKNDRALEIQNLYGTGFKFVVKEVNVKNV